MQKKPNIFSHILNNKFKATYQTLLIKDFIIPNIRKFAMARDECHSWEMCTQCDNASG